MTPKALVACVLPFGLALLSGCSARSGLDYPIKDVPMGSVRLADRFWAPRQHTDATVSIAHQIKQVEETGRIRNFELAAAALQGTRGLKFATRFAFDDSDVYKLIEAAAYTLLLERDPAIETRLDAWIGKIARAQEPDGYLYTARTIDPQKAPEMSGPERWVKLQDSHELYDVGHLYEAAAAYYRATGKRALLDVALRSADFVDSTFGPAKSQLKLVPGHEEIEIGLVKLYRLTGRTRYLRLAQFFVDQRGNAAGHKLYGEYAQDHKPIVDQAEAVGHAVRAAYLYSGTTDVAALTGQEGYARAMERIWNDVVSRKLYITGGIGAAGNIEGFGPAYDLPNETGYAETCATIAYALWNYRMFRYHGDARYMDSFERAAYNAFLSGSGLSGDLYFYPNPLASDGRHERKPWFLCACCPPNVARFIAQMGGFAYAVSGRTVYVNLYAQGSAAINTAVGNVRLVQTTGYPWDGGVHIKVAPEKPAFFALLLRVPGWAMGHPLPGGLYRYVENVEIEPAVKVNGSPLPVRVDRGYIRIERNWQDGDAVELLLPMPVHRVLAHEKLAADVGRVAVERGPLVYCAEWPDNSGRVRDLVLDDSMVLSSEPRPDMLGGITVVTAQPTQSGADVQKQKLTLIPYYAWAHRGKGEMAVWLARERAAAKPAAGVSRRPNGNP